MSESEPKPSVGQILEASAKELGGHLENEFKDLLGLSPEAAAVVTERVIGFSFAFAAEADPQRRALMLKGATALVDQLAEEKRLRLGAAQERALVIATAITAKTAQAMVTAGLAAL